MFLNYSISIVLTINDFVTSVLPSLLNNYIFEGITVISIIYLASKWKGALDTTAKVVGIAAGSTILYNSWFQRSASSSSSDNNDENKKDNKNKQISKNQVTNDKK